jgi:hypothetical protein
MIFSPAVDRPDGIGTISSFVLFFQEPLLQELGFAADGRGCRVPSCSVFGFPPVRRFRFSPLGLKVFSGESFQCWYAVR